MINIAGSGAFAIIAGFLIQIISVMYSNIQQMESVFTEIIHKEHEKGTNESESIHSIINALCAAAEDLFRRRIAQLEDEVRHSVPHRVEHRGAELARLPEALYDGVLQLAGGLVSVLARLFHEFDALHEETGKEAVDARAAHAVHAELRLVPFVAEAEQADDFELVVRLLEKFHRVVEAVLRLVETGDPVEEVLAGVALLLDLLENKLGAVERGKTGHFPRK